MADRRPTNASGVGVLLATAQSRIRGRKDLAIVVADFTTGDLIGELIWTRSDFELSYDDTWIDSETLLIARLPDFVARRPGTGELFRVTDASAVLDRYRQVGASPSR